ncbi:hypothetical protein [Streptomyces lavendofoliae]|uniref:Membrane protein n=1 Tax=Streptomyces lavendofoliae TaxID=67314 RepID=A0A918HWM3_9ACTN|nr:hypothetical protein [Streptomyces lavendofoliae]GGU38184.1 membrane protein [Streptomyces lavendofoliae]
MNRATRPSRRLLGVTAALTAALAGCGTRTAADGADRSELEARARAAQVAIENVYVTEVPGYEVAEQSVGVVGADGFSATYVNAGTGARIRLTVDRSSLDAAGCPGTPLVAGDGAPGGGDVECEADGGHWYRTSGTRHEYATGTDGRVVRLDADRGTVDRATLRRAAEAAHAAGDAELDVVLPTARPAGGVPAERGDLPPVGDGAPDNEVDAGG